MNPERPNSGEKNEKVFTTDEGEAVYGEPRPENSEELLKEQMDKDFAHANKINSELPDTKKRREAAEADRKKEEYDKLGL